MRRAVRLLRGVQEHRDIVAEAVGGRQVGLAVLADVGAIQIVEVAAEVFEQHGADAWWDEDPVFDARPFGHYFRNFYARRVLRIFPLYYGYLALVLVVWPLASPDRTMLT